MSAWDQSIFASDVNTEFLDELLSLDDDGVVEAVEDVCMLVARQSGATEDERENALCAATIAAIWAGAPFSAGDVADRYPFIRRHHGQVSEELAEVATEVLEAGADPDEVEEFLEALT
ncbi:DUF4259 domain-containing protein [Corynebacterium aquilae]|uniref:DUF4259 domain-containing protein n=1 Tax=Corynebacterium aquilae DSM 44791 TaxID=1431546 RepID=A0A1L7CEB4_9CORY|nr:DUF4259 domain-containing protein [Corynebacterium aquilae]APT84189.1 hypothetical protein CAQU_02880 [Corynebacterium aquilae DSM 44791]